MLTLTAVLSFTISLLAKFAADHLLIARIPVFGSFAGLQIAENSGVAFSITFPWKLQNILIGLALLCIAVAATKARTKAGKIAFGMIIGGAAGNIADRINDGKVTDFFQAGSFPIFNVADSFITVGVFLLLLEMIWRWWNG
ncbi:signal peptidase II [Candidatus Peregrinibacteria bacterium]|nr:signal peptidase II [Candidatus Peregrinibacteria bacterium]